MSRPQPTPGGFNWQWLNPWPLLTTLPRGVVWRELLLAALPFLLSLTLVFLTTLPAYRVFQANGNNISFYAYQGLVQDVQAYQVALLTPEVTPEDRLDARDRVLSSTRTPAQFAELNEIEGFGDARLNHIDRLIRQGTRESVGEALHEAAQLNAQSASYLNRVNRQNVETLNLMRLTLLGTALLTGLLSMALIGRTLWLWRSDQQRQAQRDARQREALSLASHELRRPLQQLLITSDLLRQVEDAGQRQSLLTQLEDCASQIASRADLSRLNDLYLNVTLNLHQRDLTGLLREMGVMHTRVRLRLPDGPLPWLVDADRVRQMVENLLENALKYTAGPVELGLRRHQGQPEITVRDYGEGLSAGLMAQVFLPFERGPKGLVQGQGLGLSLTRRYARAHGGDIVLKPAPDGNGTLAVLTLGQPEGASLAVSPEPAGSRPTF